MRGLVAAPIVAASGAAAIAWLSSVARDRIVSSATARVALPVSVGEVSIGFGSVTIDHLELGSKDDPLVHVDVKGIHVDGNAIALALRGTRAIDRVVIDAVRARAVASEKLASLFEQRASSKHGSGESRQSPELVVQRLDATLRDAHGPLLAIEDAHVDLGVERGELRIDEVRVGDHDGGSMVLSGLRAELGRASGLTLLAASLERLALDLPAAPAPPDAAIAVTEEPTPDGAGEDAVEGPPTPAPEPPAPSARTPARLVAAFRQMAKTKGDSSKTTASPRAGGPQAPASRLLARLGPKAKLRLGHGVVRGPGGKPLLTGVKGTLERVEKGALQVSGSGKGARDGSVGWDLRVWPEQLRADGSVELRSLPLGLLSPLLPSVPWYQPEDSRIDAELVIESESVERIALKGRAELRDGAIYSPRVAPQPVRDLAVAISGRGHWLPLSRRLEIEEGILAVSGVASNLSGAVEWAPEHYLFDLDARLPPTRCNDAVHAIGSDLLGELDLAEWRGKISGHVRARIDSRDLAATELDLDVDDHCEFTTVPAMADLRRFRQPFIHTVLEPDGSTFEMETGPGTPHWTYLEDVSPFFVHAVLAHEDAQFFAHHGFSPTHIRNALARNLEAGRYVVGASTISMQLVKNIFLRREKTLARKIQEVLLTWWIERVLDKRDILELYLNVIEYGPSVYGVRDAARHYFNRLPSQLSPAESVYLSTILPNPKLYHGHFERGSLSPTWVDRMKKIFARMRARGWYSTDAVEYGLSELENFRFVPEGTVTAPREIPGTTAPLPYMRDFSGSWDMDAGASDGGDGARADALGP